jgi:hypothetical protein
MTEPTPDNDPLPARVRELLTDAVNRLDRRDYAERVSFCQATGQHGTRMHLTPDDDLIEFRWGGRTLAMIPRSVLFDDQPLPEPQFIADTPDTLPADWTDQP